MLTEEEKKRLRAEEIFRAEVARSLERPASIPSRIWSSLNQPLVLWLLGSVVLALITTWYANLAERSRKREEAGRIEREIAFRVSRVEGFLSDLPGFQGSVDSAIRVIQIPPLSNENSKELLWLYRDYAGMSLIMLFSERHRLTGEPKNIESQVKALMDWCNGARGDGSSPKKLREDFREALGR